MDEPILPQHPTLANAEVMSVQWLFEPLWPGTRVMARVERGELTLTDEFGDPVNAEIDEAADVLADAIRADDAVVDAVWSAQPFVGDGSQVRARLPEPDRPSGAPEAPNPLEAERRRAFVAVDLVQLDGQPLHDIPFQERRRLLEALIEVGTFVRVSPAVKHPLASWVSSWTREGFDFYIAKHINSRYTPGQRNEDLLKLSLQLREPRGLLGSLLGGRRERIRRIRDK